MSQSSRSANQSQVNASAGGPQPNLFKLNIDCFDKIFDYLSVPDIHSIGQTCKLMQQVAGEYFKQNYSAAAKYTENDGIYTEYPDSTGTAKRAQTSGFNQFITYISHYYEKMEPLRYIQSHANEFSSIDHLYLVCSHLNKKKIACIQKLLEKCQTIQIRNCSSEGDFYQTFLKFCKNLKKLHIQEADMGHSYHRDSGPSWLLQTYPKLEYLELSPQFSRRLTELCTFFDRNANVRIFSTDANCLLANGEDFLKSNIKLDILEVKIFTSNHFYYGDDLNERLDSVYPLLKQLFDRGFYQRLHLCIERITKENCEHLISLPKLEKLCIKNYDERHNLARLTELREFVILNGANATDMNIFANEFVNLRRLFLGNSTFDCLVPFICHSTKLNVVKYFPANRNEQFKLLTLKNERERLAGARKVVIYVPDNVFLATKWKRYHGKTYFESVQLKRTESYPWDNHF